MNNTLKQSYSEQPNPPTVANEGLAAQTLWACVASEVGYGEYDTEVSLVDKIGDLETAIAGKADSTHTHHADNLLGLANVAKTGNYSDINNPPNFAAVATSGDYNDLNNKPAVYSHPASHPASMIIGLSDVATSGSYNDLTDKPNIPTVPSTLPANGGNADTVDNMHASEFATAGHTHSQYASSSHSHAAGNITGLSDVATSGSYEDLTEKPTSMTPTAHVHAQTDATGLEAALSGKASQTHTHAQADVTGLSTALSGKANASHSHAQSEVTGLEDALAGKSNTNHTHNYAAASHNHTLDNITETTNKKVFTATERTKLAGVANGANNYVHPDTHAASMITGLATVATSGKYSDLTGKPTAMTPEAHTHAQSDITGLASALSGKANSTHSHEISGVTGLSDALSGKASTSHTHTAASVGAAATNHNHNNAYMGKDLQFTNDGGGVEFSYGENSGKNVLTEISGMSQGVHTIYAIAGTAGNPESTDSYRYFVHKTASNIGWILAFGSYGSVFSNYQTAVGSFRGWKTIHNVVYAPLWTGSWYLNGSQEVTPTKKLSECEHGWILLWSDFDVDNNKAVDSDYCTTMIPKKCGSANWSGQSHIALVSTNMTNTSDGFTCKRLYVHDDKITGHNANSAAPRNDVVLRAVYEF